MMDEYSDWHATMRDLIAQSMPESSPILRKTPCHVTLAFVFLDSLPIAPAFARVEYRTVFFFLDFFLELWKVYREKVFCRIIGLFGTAGHLRIRRKCEIHHYSRELDAFLAPWIFCMRQ